MPDYEKAARVLFDVLDSIDTVDDWAKGNDAAYRKAVQRLQAGRFQVATTDGMDVTFKAHPDA